MVILKIVFVNVFFYYYRNFRFLNFHLYHCYSVYFLHLGKIISNYFLINKVIRVHFNEVDIYS